jgi:hypothetical protein
MMTRSSKLARGLAAAGILVVLGCSRDDILRPDVPDVIDQANLNSPQAAPAVYAGAVSELQFATTGGTGAIVYSALFTDEWMHASTPPAVREWDLRAVTTANSVAAGAVGPLLLLNRARTALELGAAKVTPFFPANDKRVGEMWALAALSYIYIGELYCSGVPISERSPDLDYGAPATTDQLFDRALARLTTAAGSAGGDARTTNLIAVLRGRALLNQGKFAEAATAVTAVPTNYKYEFFHSTTTARQNNNVFLQNANDIYSVSNNEGANGLNFASAGDPRIPTRSTGASRNDGVTPMVLYTKYTSAFDPVPVVFGEEARLIEAEAALKAGNAATFVAKLNEARANGSVAGLAPLTDPGTQVGREDLLFRERAFWLYLTGHRLGDLRRLVRQYGRGIESVYPTGAYHKQGLVRSTQATFIVPINEENNANYKASDCKVGQA